MNKLCECGCGKEVTNEKNRFIPGHHRPTLGKKASLETRLKISIAQTGKRVSAETKLKMSKASKGRKTISGMTGKCHSVESKLKMAIAQTGKRASKESKLKMSLASRGRKTSEETKLKLSKVKIGVKSSEDTKLKLSIAAIKRVALAAFNGNPAVPCIGRNETYILDMLQTAITEEIIRNSYDISMKTGKFPDGYIQKYNLVVEVLEPRHFKSNGELSDYDKNRELRIAWKLGCMIYYIPEQQFLSNSDKEIQRFKNFLTTLNEGVN